MSKIDYPEKIIDCLVDADRWLARYTQELAKETMDAEKKAEQYKILLANLEGIINNARTNCESILDNI